MQIFRWPIHLLAASLLAACAMNRGAGPEGPEQYAKLLGDKGHLVRVELVERRQPGDDWNYKYRAVYETATFLVTLVVVADGGISEFNIHTEDDHG